MRSFNRSSVPACSAAVPAWSAAVAAVAEFQVLERWSSARQMDGGHHVRL